MHRSSRSAKRPGRCNSRIRPAGRSVLRKTYMSFHQLLMAAQCECQRFEDAAALQALDRALAALIMEGSARSPVLAPGPSERPAHPSDMKNVLVAVAFGDPILIHSAGRPGLPGKRGSD